MNEDLRLLELMVEAKKLGITQEEFETWKEKFYNKKSVPDLKAEEIVVLASPFDNLTDDEILYYATPYFDELQAKKEAMAKQRKEDEATK